MKKTNKNNVVIYQAKNGAIELRGDFKNENIWASQKQIAEIFGINRTVVTKHIKNIFKDKELDKQVVSAKFAHTTKHGALEGKTQTKQIEAYSLDVILSVGYRTSSVKAIEFRRWANKILKEYLIQGYTVNKKQIAKNYNAFMKTVSSVQNLLPEHVLLDPKMILDLIKEFAGTWVALDAYDKESLSAIGTTKKTIKLSGKELEKAITSLRDELMKKGEASDLFAREKKNGSIEGIVGNVMQSFGGKSVYPTAEEKAAHLLYFMVKNHPFDDGNKRSGAFAFIWFLRKAKIKGMRNINPSALTALTLLIAESNPKNKDQMTALITNLLSVKK
ncbi:MAG: virulence protein RhuM/Fic/DOC family protein [Patescibacteria group bacterium]|jgi:prophage maintenance system killer protein|nr:virulence protein RhuM/Fic/DOC family protein [Patescibacteria group bacterium]